MTLTLSRIRSAIPSGAVLAVALALSGGAAADEKAGGAFGGFVPLDTATLDGERGGAPPCTGACAITSGNRATGAVTGSNTIEAGSFEGATGAFVVIQNVGNNVAIAADMTVTVTEMAPALP